MTNFIIQDEYQNSNPEVKTQNYPKPKTPNPRLTQNSNSETKNHTQNPNPKTQMFWIGFGIVTPLVTNGGFDLILNIDVKIVELVKLLTLLYSIHFTDGTYL